MKENDTLNQRLKRYIQVGSSLAPPALQVAFSKLWGTPLKPQEHASSLSQVLGSLKGPFVKIAQLLATIPGLLPDEYAEQLMTLQSGAPSMGPLFVKRRMINELGPNWQQHFSNFNEKAMAAASLGQVHQARDLQGNVLAVKLQYPNMLGTIKADLQQLKVIATLYEKYDAVLDHQEILQEITDRLLEELDYGREARHIGYFQKMLKDEPSIHVPQVYPYLSTSKLLTMSWQEGLSIDQVLDAPLDLRNQIAKNLFQAWYKPFYHYGILHGDAHMGNYKVTLQGDLHMLDFGCVRLFPASFIRGVISLYRALQQNDLDLAITAYEAWGFQNLSKDLIEALNLWARFLYDPLLEDRIRPIRPDQDIQEGKRILKQVHQALKDLGGIRPPKGFVFVDRSAIGLGSVFIRLGACLNWHQQFESLIQDFSETSLTASQQEITA